MNKAGSAIIDESIVGVCACIFLLPPTSHISFLIFGLFVPFTRLLIFLSHISTQDRIFGIFVLCRQRYLFYYLITISISSTVLLENKDKKKVSLPKSSVVKKTSGVVVPPSRHLPSHSAPHTNNSFSGSHTNSSSGPGRPALHETSSSSSGSNGHFQASNSSHAPYRVQQQLQQKCHSSKPSSTHDIVKRPIRSVLRSSD